jgi:hypothetical protein
MRTTVVLLPLEVVRPLPETLLPAAFVLGDEAAAAGCD